MTGRVLLPLALAGTGLVAVRWHRPLGRWHFAASPWSPTERAGRLMERGYLVLGIVLAGIGVAWLMLAAIVS